MNRLDYIAYACDMREICAEVKGNCLQCPTLSRKLCVENYNGLHVEKTPILKLASVHRINNEGGK